MKNRTSLIGMTTAASLLGFLAAVGLATPDLASAKDKHHGAKVQHVAGGCPPGLAKKSPACIPPGQAKKLDGRHDDDRRVCIDRKGAYVEREDAFRYNDRYDQVYSYRVGDRLRGDYVLIPSPDLYGLDRYGTYYRAGDGVYQVDKDTMEVMAIIGLASRLLN